MTATPPLPVTVIAGYLGAGKTTLINKLLQQAAGQRLLVMVNDFGDIAIDADLIAAQDGDSITLSNGCVCCSLGGDLFQAFSAALDRKPRPDRLVIECSGVAEPQRIANIARAEPDLRLDLIVTLADALNFHGHLDDPLIGKTIERQVEAADLILVTKEDLAAKEAFQSCLARLRERAPATEILTPSSGPSLTNLLLDRASPDHRSSDPEAVQARDHSEIYESWSYVGDFAFSAEPLRQQLKELPPGILRLKGIARAPMAESQTEFHIAGRQVDLQQVPAPAEDSPALRVVAIGLRGRLPRAALAACFTDPARDDIEPRTELSEVS